MEKTWKPVAAGVLDIVAGALGLLVVFGMVIAIMVTSQPSAHFGPFPGMIPGFVPNLLLISSIPVAVTSLLALVGGIYALQRRKWGLALAGSIAAIFASTPLLGPLPVGIVATIYLPH